MIFPDYAATRDHLKMGAKSKAATVPKYALHQSECPFQRGRSPPRAAPLPIEFRRHYSSTLHPHHS